MRKKFSLGDLFSAISKMVADEEVTGKQVTPQSAAHQLEMENAILVLAAEVVRCDRNFSASTEKHILEYFAHQFGSAGRNKRVERVSRHVELGTEAYIKIACKELKLLTTYESRLNILHFLFGVAAADDFVNAREMRCVQRLAGYLGVQAADFNTMRETFLHRHNPYAVLEIEEGVSLRQVKSAYRKMILKYHPDKRDPQIPQREAEEKFREVQRAFELICSELEG